MGKDKLSTSGLHERIRKEQRQKQLGDAFEWSKPYWSRLVGTDKMTPEQEQVIEESNMYTGEWSLKD